jgi:dCTP deaminase
MILSGRRIQELLTEGMGLVITPYEEACQQPASYDLRIGENVILATGTCTLVPSLEWVELPPDVAATLRCRSSFARKGVLLGGGFVDPGFRGQLTLCLANMGREPLALHKEDRVVQMIFHEVSMNDALYQGRYQDSEGVVPAR